VLERGDDRVLNELLGEIEVAEEPRQAGGDRARFLAECPVDRVR
jgi:hypothetical protein